MKKDENQFEKLSLIFFALSNIPLLFWVINLILTKLFDSSTVTIMSGVMCCSYVFLFLSNPVGLVLGVISFVKTRKFLGLMLNGIYILIAIIGVVIIALDDLGNN